MALMSDYKSGRSINDIAGWTQYNDVINFRTQYLNVTS